MYGGNVCTSVSARTACRQSIEAKAKMACFPLVSIHCIVRVTCNFARLCPVSLHTIEFNALPQLRKLCTRSALQFSRFACPTSQKRLGLTNDHERLRRPSDGLLAECDNGVITRALVNLCIGVANLCVLELTVRIVDLVAGHVHVFLRAIGSEASVRSIRHTGIIHEPVILPVAPAIVNVAVDVAEVAVVVAIEVRLKAIGSECEEVVVGLIVRGATRRNRISRCNIMHHTMSTINSRCRPTKVQGFAFKKRRNSPTQRALDVNSLISVDGFLARVN